MTWTVYVLAVLAGSYTTICALSGRATITMAIANRNKRRMVAS